MIGPVNYPCFPVRMQQIFCCKQAIHCAFQRRIPLCVSKRIVRLIFALFQIQILFIDMYLALRPVIIDSPGVFLAVCPIAMAEIASTSRLYR